MNAVSRGAARLTVAVCTRNRPADLARCLRSVTDAALLTESGVAEILVVDDGELPVGFVEELRRSVGRWSGRFTCRRPSTGSGLFNARLAAVDAAVGEVIVFLDDDVEIDPGYLARLSGRYREWPEAVGIGGVDDLLRPVSLPKRLFGRTFLLDSGHAGRLSPSGFSDSIARWVGAGAPFETEYLSGCNMSFRREALRAIDRVSWLKGYSMGEDIYLSVAAATHGRLWVDPGLRVRHHRSATPRVPDRALAYATVVNPYRLLRARGAGRWRYGALAWSIVGLLLKDAVRLSRWGLIPGYFQGVRDIVSRRSTTDIM